MVTLFDFGIGHEQRFHQVIGLRAGPDGGHVRTDPSTRSADGVAGDAGQVGSAVDELTALRIAAGRRPGGHFADELVGEGLGVGRQTGPLCQSEHQFHVITAAFASHPHAGTGCRGGNPRSGQEGC